MAQNWEVFDFEVKKNRECRNRAAHNELCPLTLLSVYPFSIIFCICFAVQVVSVKVVGDCKASPSVFYCPLVVKQINILSLPCTVCACCAENYLLTCLLNYSKMNSMPLQDTVRPLSLNAYSCSGGVGVMVVSPSTNQEARHPGHVGERVPHCLLLSRMALQSSDHDRSRL